MESPVLCWWGDEIRIIDPCDASTARVLAKPGDPLPEILQAAAGCKGSGRVRIVYQPDALEVHEIGLAGIPLNPRRADGPGRKRVRRLLAREFAALAEPNAVWCLCPGDTGSGAVLYLERDSLLPKIVEGLARIGLCVEGAWPLPVLADRPPSPSAGPGCLSLVATAGRAIVACVSAAGDRGVDLHNRGDAPEAAAASLRSALARFDESQHPPGWLAVEESPRAAALRSAAAGLGLTEISVAGLLARARLLSPGGWADLLPGRPWWMRPRARRRLIAGAAILAMLTSALCAHIAGARKSARLALRQREEAALLHVRAEAGERQTRTERIKALLASEAELATERPVLGDFLPALAASFPRSAVLGEIAMSDGQITLLGRICDRSVRTADAAARLCSDLAPSGAQWTLRSDPLPSGGFDFVLRGSVERRPKSAEEKPAASGDTPQALERNETGFAQACSRLPTDASFQQMLAALSRRGWIAAAPAVDRRNGYELRHYLLRLANPRLDAWPEIVASIRLICDQPGLTIERLLLTAAPDGAAVFIRAELGLTIRLKLRAVSRAGACAPRRRRISEPLHSATTRLSRSC